MWSGRPVTDSHFYCPFVFLILPVFQFQALMDVRHHSSLHMSSNDDKQISTENLAKKMFLEKGVPHRKNFQGKSPQLTDLWSRFIQTFLLGKLLQKCFNRLLWKWLQTLCLVWQVNCRFTDLSAKIIDSRVSNSRNLQCISEIALLTIDIVKFHKVVEGAFQNKYY